MRKEQSTEKEMWLALEAAFATKARNPIRKQLMIGYSAVPDSFDFLVTALEIIQKTELTIEFTTKRLQTEDVKRMEQKITAFSVEKTKKLTNSKKFVISMVISKSIAVRNLQVKLIQRARRMRWGSCLQASFKMKKGRWGGSSRTFAIPAIHRLRMGQ